MLHYVDLHIHGRYARSTSKDLGIATLEKWARIKGVTVLGTGDFTHPKWVEEIEKNTAENKDGILLTKTGMPFVWQTEISFVFTQGGKGRRVHLVVLAPDGGVARQITKTLGKRGRLDYDGRPIFGMSCVEFTEKMMSISEDIEIIPAHAWTPWFGVFGSKSGFDSLRDCFLDQTRNIHAIETGMSSDPAMNWRLSQLDGITLTSSSDAHSYWPWRLGRECNVMDLKELSYDAILQAIRTRKGFKETIEVDPGYGKYHIDGHRLCGIALTPEESRKLNGICPKCKRPLTIGVLSRIEGLADRPDGFTPKDAVPFRTLIPLSELIAHAIGSPLASKKVWAVYDKLIAAFKSEFAILMDASPKDIERISGKDLSALIVRNRERRLKVEPGYDGEYGKLV